MKNVWIMYTILQTATITAHKQKLKDIVDTVVCAGSFNTLVTAIRVAGLVNILKSTGPFTLFAPNDAAFKKLHPVTLDAILNDERKLTDILKYHIVPGRIMVADTIKQRFIKKRSLNTLKGTALSMDISGGKVSINEAELIKADIMCNNGVIHMINKFMMP